MREPSSQLPQVSLKPMTHMKFFACESHLCKSLLQVNSHRCQSWTHLKVFFRKWLSKTTSEKKNCHKVNSDCLVSSPRLAGCYTGIISLHGRENWVGWSVVPAALSQPRRLLQHIWLLCDASGGLIYADFCLSSSRYAADATDVMSQGSASRLTTFYHSAAAQIEKLIWFPSYSTV